MKIKIQLNNREKTLMFATSWSLFMVAAILVFIGFMVYKMTPQNVFLRVPASQLQEGSRQITVRAVNLGNVTEVLYVGTAIAEAKNGSLTSQWTPPNQLEGKAYVIEICTDSIGSASETCFKHSSVQGVSTYTPTKPVNGPLVSCPYYVGKNRPSFFANLFGTNTVDLSSRVYCSSDVTGDRDFATYSRIDAIASTRSSGITTQGGILVSENGQVKTVSYEEILDDLSEELPTAADVAKQLFLSATITPPKDSDAQALNLSGNELSISGGNVVTLPVKEYAPADSSTSGILSSNDWNTFSAKENSLTFDSSFLRTGDSLALMSCAAGEILKNDGSTWVCANDVGAGSGVYGAGNGISIDAFSNINNTGLLSLTTSGALGNSAGQSPAITLATTADFSQLGSQLALSSTGVSAGTYNNVTVNTQGRVTNGMNVTYLTTEGDGVVGNEISGIVSGGGLVMTGSGTGVSPYRIGLITTCSSGQLMKWNGASWACAADVDTDTNTDAQTLSFNPGTNQLGIAAGNTVDLSALKDNTDAQTLSILGNVISLTNGGNITLPADQNTTYTAGSGLILTGTVMAVNAPTCIGTQKLSWNGSAFVCGADVDTDTNTDAQTIAWDNGTRALSISGGNAIAIPDTNTDAQTLSYNSATGAVSISGGTGFTLPLANASTRGLLGSADWSAFNGKENVLSFSNGLLRTTNSVELMSCATNEVLKNNGSAWLCANDVDTDTNTTYSAGSGLSLTGTTFALAGTSVLAGTYNSLTVDTLGRVTTGTNVGYLTSENDGTVGNELTDVSGSGLIRTGTGTVGDPYRVGFTTSCGSNQILKYVAGVWTCANDVDTDTDTNTDAQQLSFNTTTSQLSIGGGNTVDLSQLAIDTDTDDQSLSLTTNTLSLSDGGSVDLTAYLDNTDSQALSWNAGSRTLSLSGGGQVVISDADTDTDTTYSAGNGLSLSGTTFSVNSPTCGAGEFTAWNGTAFTCAVPAGSGVDTTNFNIATNGGVGENISAGETVNFVNGTGVNASRSGNDVSFSLANTGTAGTYGSSTSIPVITVDAQGRVTSTSEQAIPTASAGTTGLLSATDFVTFSTKENALTFSDGLSRSGDVVSLMDCAGSQIVQRNGGDTAWVCASQVTDTNTTYSAGTGLTLVGTTFGLEGTSVTPGTYNNVSVDGLGRVTNGTNMSYLTAETDGVVGNEIVDVSGSGLVRTGAGTTGDPYRVGLITTCTDTQLLKYTIAGGWACANDIDTDTDTDDQTLSYNTGTNILTIADGNTVDLSTLKDNTDTQDLAWDNGTRTLSLVDGGSVVISDADTTYSAGTGISFAGTVISATLGVAIDSSEIMDGVIAAVDLDETGVSAGTYGDSGVSIAQLTVNAQGQVTSINSRSLPTANTTTTGVLSDTDWDVFNGKENVLTFSDGLSRAANNVTLMDCAADQIIQRNGGDSAWVCASQVVDTDTNTTYSAGAGLSLVGTTFSLAGTSVIAGTYNNLTVDTLGRVTAASNISYLTAEVDGVIGNEVAGVVNNGGLVMTGAGTGGDPYRLGLITACLDGQLLKYTAAGGWACATDVDTDTDTDDQSLSYNTGTNILTIADGNTVDLSTLKDNTDTQDLSWDNGTRTLSLVDGGSVVISDTNTTYAAGSGLALVGTEFSIDSPTCSGTDKLQWTGVAFVCAADVDTDTNTTYSAGTGISFAGTVISSTLGTTIDSSEIVDASITADDLDETGVIAGTYGDSGVSIAQLTVNAQGQVTGVSSRSLPTANTTTTGVLSSTDWNTFNGKENVLTFGDGLSRSGDAVTLMDCAGSQIIQRNGGDTAWVCAAQVTDTNTTYSAGTGLTLTGTTFALEGTSVVAGSYNNVTVDVLGRVTAATNISYLTAEVDGVIGNEVAGVVNSGGLVMTGAGTGGDPYRLGLITMCGDGQLLKYTTAGGWACASDIDTDTDTDDQSLSYNTGTNILTIADGNTVDLSALKDNTDTQDLTWNGGTRTLSLTDGGSVVISDSDTTYTAGNGLSLAANEFAIDSPTCASTDKLQWTGTAFVCAADVDTDTNTTYSAGTGISFAGTVISSTLGVTVDSSEITDGTITADDLEETGAVAGTYGDSGVSVAQLSVNAQGQVTSVSSRALPTAATGVTGVLSSTDWNTFNGKENVLTFGDGLSRSSNAVSLMDCAASQIIQRNGGDSAWVCANQAVDTDTNTTYSAGTGLSLVGTTFALEGTSVIAGTYNNVTVDALGRVTNGTNVSYLTSETDGVIGNEVAGVVNSGGLVMTGAGTGGDPYRLGLITTCGNNQLLKYTAGGGWACASDIDTDTDDQTLSYNTGTNILTIADGNTVDLTSLKDNTDTQDLSWDGGTRTLSLTDGGNVVISDANTTYSAALNGGLALNSTAFSLQACSTNQILKATAVAGEWGCAADIDTDTNTTYSEGTGISFAGTVISTTLGVAIDTSEITDNTVAAADLATSGASAGTYSDSGVSVAQLTVNNKGQVTSVSNRALPTATTGVTGVLSSTDWNTFNGKENVLSFNGPLSRVGNAVSIAACGSTQIYQYNGSAWVCANQVVDTDTNTTYSAGSGLTMTGTTLSLNCSTTANTAFCNGGNSYGAAATIGTNDAFGLNIETSGAVAATFSATGELLLKDLSNNAISFQVQNSSAVPHFTVDTANSQLLVGSSISDENAIELVLDSYNNATDPAGTNGAMYYNSALGKFRCHEGSAWKDCITVAGYTLTVQALTSSPVDSQTVYFGNMPKAPITTANVSKIYIPKTGTIKRAEIYNYSGTAGSNQAWSLYIRKNNTTDTLIATVSAATNERVFHNTGLNIAVTAGEYIEIKGVQPAWTTNPLTSIYGGYVYIE